MKKKRFMKLLALASCVTLLTGCESEAFFGLGKYWNQFTDWGNGLLVKMGLKKEEQKDEKKDEEKPSGDQGGEQEGGEQGGQEEQKTPSMSIAELPEKLEVGEALDLDEYVTLENASEYEVVLEANSSSLAKVEGHVLTATDEGRISFTVKCGDLSKSLSIDAVRGSREALIEYFDGVENRYSVLVYQEEQTAGADTEEDESDDEYEWMMADIILHDTNYILSFYGWDSDETTGASIPGGFLRFGEQAEECYTFSIGEDDLGEEQVELGQELGLVYFNAYNPSFGVDFSKAEYEYDSDYDMDLYVIEGNDASWFAEESLFVPNGAFGAQGQYPVDRVEFNIYDEAEEGEPESLAVDAYVYVTFQGEEVLVEIATLYTAEEAVGYELLQEYCVPENKPEGVDYWEYFGLGLDNFFLGEGAYVGQTGIMSVEYGWYDDNYAAIDMPEDVVDTNFEYMPIGSKTLLTTPNSVWEVDADYNPLSGKMFVAGEGENPGTTYSIYSTQNGYYAEEADEGVWEDDALVFAGLHDRTNYAPGQILSAQDFTHMEPGENEGDPEQEVYDYTVFSFGLGKVGGFIDALVAGDNGLYMVSALIDFYAGYGVDLLSYISGSLIVDPNSGVAQLSIEFTYSTNENWVATFTSAYNPNVTQLTDQFEAYMLANVINAA